MSVPSRPADERNENIGSYYKAPQDPNIFKINNNLAGLLYVSDCNGTIEYNGDVPNIRFDLDNGYYDIVTEDNLIFVDSDGTVRRYFVHGDETASDFYCTNDGITDAEYQSMPESSKNLYCDVIGGSVLESGININKTGSQLDSASTIIVIEKNVSGSGAQFTSQISLPSFQAGLKNISNHDLAQVSQIITDVSDLDGVDYSLTPIYDFPSLSGQETSAIREKCRYFIRDIYYRYLGREADESGLHYYGNKIYDIFVRCAFGDCKYWLVNDLVVEEIRNSPEGLQYQERLKAGTVEKPEYVMPSFGSYTQPEKWKRLWGDSFFSKSFAASGGGKLIGIKVDKPGLAYKIGDTFTVTSTDNDLPQITPAEFELTAVDESGGLHFLKSPICDVVRETVRSVGVDIWRPPEQIQPIGDCANQDVFINRAIVTGSLDGVVIGSGPYGITSDKGTAAVHAGLIKVGTTAEISWYSAGPEKISNYNGTTANGVTSVSESPDGLASALCGINLKLIRILSEDAPPQEPTQEILELVVDYNNPDSALKFIVEKNNTLEYNDKTKNRVIDQVIDFPTPNTTDEVLSESGEQTLQLFMLEISRLPSVVEFQQYTRLLYASGAILTQDITNKFRDQFSNELDTVDQVIRILSAADVEAMKPKPEELEAEDIYSDFNCRYDRREFYQPNEHGNSLTDIWNFLGRPNGYSESNAGAYIDSIVCGRPKNEDLKQDNEPDMSDFAGLRVQRWLPCANNTNGGDTNLGGVFTDFVPCPEPDVDCQNQTYETELAEFDSLAQITYNNGFKRTGDFVKGTPKDPQAKIINDAYLDKNVLGRPAEREGLEYWVAEANRTITGTNAIYWPQGKLVYADGDEKVVNLVKQTTNNIAELINQQYLNVLKRPAEEAGLDFWVSEYDKYKPFTGQNAIYQNGRLFMNDGFVTDNAFVQTPSNEIATAINNTYLSVLGRPAEQAGLDYWVETAQSAGIGATINAIRSAATTELARGGVKKLITGINMVLYLIDEGATQELTKGGVVSVTVGIDRTLEHLIYIAQNEKQLGGVASYDLFCSYTSSGEIDLSWFKNTRLPPWWGTLSLQKPRMLSFNKEDKIYLLNSPSNQTEIYKGFSEDSSESNLKSEFSLEFVVDWPEMTGQVESGYNTPTYRKFVKVSWYKEVPGQPLELRAQYQYSNVPNLEPGEFISGPVIQNPALPDLVTFTTNSNLSQFTTTLRVQELKEGEISKEQAMNLAWDEIPNKETRYYAEITLENIPITSDTKNFVPGVGGTDTKAPGSLPNSGCKFITDTVIPVKECWNGEVIPITSICPPGPVCPNGEKVCPNGETVCIEDNCPPGPPPPPPPQNCNSLSVSCGSSQKINVFTNSDTSITFSYRVNNAQYCSNKGQAKVSIRRYWPCAFFRPISGFENQWLVQKQPVSIVNGVAEYTMKVNTAKDDYFPGDNCHWMYVAYWEISHPNITCRPNAWDNPGCDYDDGLDTLEEILCIQQQSCAGGQSFKNTNLVTGSIKSVKVLNPYPNPSIVPILSNSYPIDPGQPNPADPAGNDWNWYYDCPSYKFNDAFGGDISDLPIEDYNWKHISGPSFGSPSRLNRQNLLRISSWVWRYNPGGILPKGCVDPSDNQLVNYQVYKAQGWEDNTSLADNGLGFAVGDVLEFVPSRADPDTLPVRVEVTEISPMTSRSALCSSECPICEQSIEVVVSDTTDCGPVDYPSMIENNEESGGFVNNGTFRVGSKWFTSPNDNVTALSSEEAKVKTDSKGKYVELILEADVVIAPAVVGDQITSGRYNSVEFTIDDLQDRYQRCCVNQMADFDCANLPPGWCEDYENGLIGNGVDVKCDAEMRVVAHWYYKYTFDNGAQSDYRLIEYLDNGQPANSVPEDFYPSSAGNNPGALILEYRNREVAYKESPYKGSLYAGADISSRRIYYPDNVNSVEIFLELKASNDQWGKEIYHPPPKGWDEDDFGTRTRVSSLRLPWRPMTIYAYGFKDRIFSIGKFSIGKKIKLPTVDWLLRIDRCAEAEVYASLEYAYFEKTFVCGDKQSDTWYECVYKKDDITGEPEASETFRINGVDGSRSGYPAFNNKGTICRPQTVDDYGTFADCIRKTNVVLEANTTDGLGTFEIKWNDVPQPGTAESGLPEPGQGECVYGLKILWYVNGRLRSISTPGVNGYNFLSCGAKTQDLSNYMWDPDREYEVEAFVVLNNTNFNIAYKQVDFDWDVNKGDPYSWNDPTAWALRDATREEPINIYDEIVDGYPTTLDGKFWQLVLSSAGCKVKGNSGPGQPNPPPIDNIDPSASIDLIANGPTNVTLSAGSASVNFTAIADWDDGNYPPTPEPSLLTYGTINNSGGDREFNISRKTWTQTFTQPGTYVIGASFRKNYCPPNTTPTSTCAGKTSVFVRDSVTVTVEAEIISTKPSATAVAATYSLEQNGCGLILDGVPVEIYQNIEITQGTGEYEWDEVTTTSGNYQRNGTTLTQTITRSRTSNGQYGTTVIFLKNGSEVYREGSGAGTWCTIVSDSSPLNPGNTPTIPGNPGTNPQ